MQRVTIAVVCLLLAACARPADKTVSVANYLPDALSQPMPLLYDKAMAGDADDWLKFGLALAAGRPSPAIISDADQARLAVLNDRLQAAKRDWLKENPPDSLDRVPWDYQINLDQEDATLIWQADQKLSADYWLSRAESAKAVKSFIPAWRNKWGSGSAITTYKPAINDAILLSAITCAVAVRSQAGIRMAPLPEVVWRLRNRDVHDFVAKAVNSGDHHDYALGRSACGRAFDHYVTLLKTDM
jgi:hypothetical protein